MAEVKFLVQCPNCLQYLHDEKAEDPQEIWTLIPAHECFIGSRRVQVSAQPVEGQLSWTWTPS